MNHIHRFQFIGHAYRADGPFRPTVQKDSDGKPSKSGPSYLVKYPRESDAKFAARNDVAFFESPLARAASQFVGHISKKPVAREIKGDLMTAMAENIDLKGNALDVFWQDFMKEAKARGSMLLLVDMPSTLGDNQLDQIANRKAPYWRPIDPADLEEYALDDSGKFQSVKFKGKYDAGDEMVDCSWYFDAEKWICWKDDKSKLGEGKHPCGETPVLSFTESGTFPCFGDFSAIADLSKRHFNVESELDEILRAQTFSILTYPLPDGVDSNTAKEVAQTVGETIGTNNMLCHSGGKPDFIAPSDGPAETYMKRAEKLEARIREIGLDVSASNQRESAEALKRRFEKLNAGLSSFAERIEHLERRAWGLSMKWLGMTEAPTTTWPRDFDVADIIIELDVLDRMIESNMPDEVIRAQRRKVVAAQFDGMDDGDISDLQKSIDNQASSL